VRKEGNGEKDELYIYPAATWKRGRLAAPNSGELARTPFISIEERKKEVDAPKVSSKRKGEKKEYLLFRESGKKNKRS